MSSKVSAGQRSSLDWTLSVYQHSSLINHAKNCAQTREVIKLYLHNISISISSMIYFYNLHNWSVFSLHPQLDWQSLQFYFIFFWAEHSGAGADLRPDLNSWLRGKLPLWAPTPAGQCWEPGSLKETKLITVRAVAAGGKRLHSGRKISGDLRSGAQTGRWRKSCSGLGTDLCRRACSSGEESSVISVGYLDIITS